MPATSPPTRALALLSAPTQGQSTDGPGHVLVDPDSAHLRVDDLAATRGDGVFETILVTDGHPQSLTEHLARFARSAELLDLPAPVPAPWTDAVHGVVRALPPASEVLVKTVLTRGVEDSGVPTGWALAFPNKDFRRERTDGIDVLLLDRGYRSDVAESSPWLLQGAKTLSYAPNLAAQRHARRLGADDVVFVSSDGLVLEGPNSTLLARFGSRLVTPPPALGILHGTTQQRIFGWGRLRGLETAYERLTVPDLDRADDLWLCSSGRLAAPVRSLDGRARTVDGVRQQDLLQHLLTSRD